MARASDTAGGTSCRLAPSPLEAGKRPGPCSASADDLVRVPCRPRPTRPRSTARPSRSRPFGSLWRCPYSGPCVLLAFGPLARVLACRGIRCGRPHSRDEQEEESHGQREESTFHLVSLRAVGVTPRHGGSGVGTTTGSSQPGWSIEERYVPRGLSSRATRSRRPRRGAASMKKAMSAATAATGALGTRPPDVPEPPFPYERDWPNGNCGPCALRGGADCALCGFLVGVERDPLGEPSERCTAIGVSIGGGVVDSVPRCPGTWRAPRGVWPPPSAGVPGVSAGTMSTDTSTPGTPRPGSRSSGSAASQWSVRTVTSTSTDGRTTPSDGTSDAPRRGGNFGVSGTSTVNTGPRPGVAGAGSVDITGESGDTGVASVRCGAASPSSAGAPAAPSHVQSQVQIHVQLSGVWLSIRVETAVVSSQNVNVQFQFQRPAGEASGAVRLV